jgi:catechol 2,3-dioxygenase-like lactoylglutathione lyase family enzyme
MTRFVSVSPRLPVRDIPATVAWYTEVLGFESGEPWPADNPTFVLLDREGVTVQFYVPDDPAAQVGEGTLAFTVTDATALHASLADGVPIEWGPEVYWYGRREFAVRDPNGYLIIFSEETSDPATCEQE